MLYVTVTLYNYVYTSKLNIHSNIQANRAWYQFSNPFTFISIRVFGLTQNIIECAGKKTEMALKQQNL